MGDTEPDFNKTSLRDKLNKLNNLAAAVAKSPTRILSTEEFMGVERVSQDSNPNIAHSVPVGEPHVRVSHPAEFFASKVHVDSGNMNGSLSNDSTHPSDNEDLQKKSPGYADQQPPPVIKPVVVDDGLKDVASGKPVGVSKNSGSYAFTMNNGEGTSKKGPVSYASALNSEVSNRKANFRFMEATVEAEGVDLLIPMQSVIEVNSRFSNSLYGYFLGERLAFPVVENYVKNTWAKFGLKKVMMNASGFFFFQFEARKGMMDVLEKGPWMIRSNPIFLGEWTPNVSLTKQDRTTVPVWVKMYDVPLVAYTEDGLSMLASKLGTPILLDSYTSHMCFNSWGRHSFARALIEIDSTKGFKDCLIVGIPNMNGEGFSKESVTVEYEWRPPHCKHCMVFGHDDTYCTLQVRVVAELNKEKPKDDGFVTVERKKGRNKGKQVEGIKLTKPKPQFVYRVKPQNTNATDGKPPETKKSNKDMPTTSSTQRANVGEASTSRFTSIDTSNIFSALGDGVDEFGFDTGGNTKGSHEDCNIRHNPVTHDDPDSDDEEVEEVFNEGRN